MVAKDLGNLGDKPAATRFGHSRKPGACRLADGEAKIVFLELTSSQP